MTGGKWTTYRNMAEDCVDHAATLARLPERPCVTRELKVHGHHEEASQFGPLAVYGSDAPLVRGPRSRRAAARGSGCIPLFPIARAEVAWAARFEMARTVEDVLARRTRALFLDARAAIEMAPAVAGILAAELGRTAEWASVQAEEFRRLAAGLPRGSAERLASQGEAVGEGAGETRLQDLVLGLLDSVGDAMDGDRPAPAVVDRERGQRIAVPRLADGPGIDQVPHPGLAA